MSFDIFLQAFRAGDGSVGDGSAVAEILEPLIVERGDGWARFATADGGADVYGLDDAATGLLVNHTSGSAVFEVLYDIARRGGFVLLPVGCPTCIPDPEMVDHLPPDVAADVVVVKSGEDLARSIIR